MAHVGRLMFLSHFGTYQGVTDKQDLLKIKRNPEVKEFQQDNKPRLFLYRLKQMHSAFRECIVEQMRENERKSFQIPVWDGINCMQV